MSHDFHTTQYETWLRYESILQIYIFQASLYRNVFCSYEKIHFVQNIFLYYWHLCIEKENQNSSKIWRSIDIFCYFCLLNSEIGYLIFEELPISRRVLPTTSNIIMKIGKTCRPMQRLKSFKCKSQIDKSNIFSFLAFIQGSIIA